jgi:GntR family transcriptional regulator
VRRALGDLEGERVIFRLAGKGSFVSKPTPVQSLARLEGFAEAMGAQGFEIVNRVLSVRSLPADAEVAERLALAPGAPVTELRRVRLLNRAPVSLDVTFVAADLGARLAREDLATRDVFVILENDYGIALGHADLHLDAIAADAALARHLRLARGAPVLHVERLTHTATGKPLDFEHLYYRGDGFKHRLRIDRTRS